MKEKGFTLIELLAVIVILAIIALIAVPIILNIIEDSKNSSNKRSIELYAKAIENAIGQYQLKNSQDTEITLEKIDTYIEYKGNKVECETTEINEDGTIYLDKCKIDNKEVEYSYGEKKDKTIPVYMWTMYGKSIGDTINLDSSSGFVDPTQKEYYLKYVVDKNNKITESYACIIFNNKETCLRGGSPNYHENNILILKGLQNEGFSCTFEEDLSRCVSDRFSWYAYSNGSVSVIDDLDGFANYGHCDVNFDGGSSCNSF